MLELIETDPERALALAASFRWRSELPANITRYFEQWVDGRGALDVLVATDFEQNKATVSRYVQLDGKHYAAYVYGRRQGQVSQARIPLHGIALDGKLAVQADPIRLLEPAEAEALAKQRGEAVEQICGISGQPANYRPQLVVADIGGEIRYLCCVDHAPLLSRRVAPAPNRR